MQYALGELPAAARTLAWVLQKAPKDRFVLEVKGIVLRDMGWHEVALEVRLRCGGVRLRLRDSRWSAGLLQGPGR